jgi:hypothetical protein
MIRFFAMTSSLTADSASMDKRVMAGWRQPIESAVNDVEVAALEEISRSRAEPAIRVERARMLLAYRESRSFLRWGVRGGAPSDGPALHGAGRSRRAMAALDDRPRPARHRRSPLKPRASKTWPAVRPKNSAIRTNCGRRAFSPAMRVNMGRRRGMTVSSTWPRAPCARSSMSRR